MKLSWKNQGNTLISKELSGNSLSKEFQLDLLGKLSFMSGVFRIFRQLSKFQLNLVRDGPSINFWGCQRLPTNIFCLRRFFLVVVVVVVVVVV